MPLLAPINNAFKPERRPAYVEDDPRYVGPNGDLRSLMRGIDENLKILSKLPEESLYYAQSQEFLRLFDELACVAQIKNGWDGYTAPAPRADTIATAELVLRGLQRRLVTPDWITSSAEGGVAISFLSKSARRALIELLNDGENYVLLYDLQGKTQTIELTEQFDDNGLERLVSILESYLQE
ncbi:MAG: hypothetical protein WA700_05845 [Acidobacteriaceae bacterium]